MAVEITYQCELSEGIHARPAGYIARLCNTFQADIMWQNTRTGRKANAKSALSLVASDTLPDDQCRITLCGPDAQVAMTELADLLKNLPTFTVDPEPESELTAGYLPRCLRELQPCYLSGTRISPGIAIAKPVVLQSITFADLHASDPVGPFSPQHEQRQLVSALQTLRMAKESALLITQGIEHDLAEAHLSFITDSAFQDSIFSHLSAHNNAWLAIVRATMDFSAMLGSSSSQYIQERSLDILDIATQLLSTLYGEQAVMENHTVLTEPAIVFASTLTPGQFLAIDKTQLAALVLSSTGKTSHTAILARSLTIPTLTDIDFTTLELSSQQEIVFDGDLGILITATNEKLLRYYRHEMDVQQQMRQKRQTPSTFSAKGDCPLLTPEAILWGLDAADKNEVIKKMVDSLWLDQHTDCRDKLCQDLWAREEPFPTVVGSGFAIPHARSDAIHHSMISVATLSQPVAWGGVQVEMVFMLTISRSAEENEHMKFFSTLARMLMNDEFVEQAKGATTPDALYNLIFTALAF